MDLLPDAIVEYILSLISNARDVAVCKCVSKQWRDSTPCIRSLRFPRNSFANHTGGLSPDTIILRLISSIVHLEELVVYCPFSSTGLSSWLSSVGPSLRRLELRMDDLADPQASQHSRSKLECLNSAPNLESLKLWGVLMTRKFSWNVFQKMKSLEIVGAKLVTRVFDTVLGACPNLSNLLIYDCQCQSLTSVVIGLNHLEQCKLDLYSLDDCTLLMYCPKIQLLEVQGCRRIQARGTSSLRSLSISSNKGKMHMVDFEKLVSLEYLSIRGVQWCWDAISKILECGSEVKHLYMKVEFTGNSSNALEPFPEIDFVDFFNNHPNLQKFDIHGAMFSALSQKNSLKNVYPDFVVSSLEEVTVTIRSALNPEQKMSTLESFIKYGKNLKTIVINILKMKGSHSSVNDLFDEICKLRYLNSKIVRIE